MMDESYLLQRAQDAEARLNALKQTIEPVKERIQQFKENFGVKERSNGELIIDYKRFVSALGPEQALELRAEIDERWHISGAAGEKPRIRVMETR